MTETFIEQKIALKVGEVKAFTDISLDFLRKTGRVLSDVYGKDFIDNLQKDFKKLSIEISTLQKGTQYTTEIQEKSKKTIAKITKMQDMYIKDEWDNPTELTEWLGFFAGSAVVHWGLVLGRANKSKNAKLALICRSGKKINTTFFNKIVSVAQDL